MCSFVGRSYLPCQKASRFHLKRSNTQTQLLVGGPMGQAQDWCVILGTAGKSAG